MKKMADVLVNNQIILTGLPQKGSGKTAQQRLEPESPAFQMSGLLQWESSPSLTFQLEVQLKKEVQRDFENCFPEEKSTVKFPRKLHQKVN